MKVLVTGGAGFIGTNVVRRLLDEGNEVVVLDDLSTGLESNIAGLDVDFRRGSITDPATVSSAARSTDAIIHLAARGSVPRSVAHPVATHEVNATGTLNVLEAARASGTYVVMSSSSSVYGANPLLPKVERTWTQPLSPYAASKLAGEAYLSSYREVYDLPALAFRLFNVFGPWQRPDHDYAAVIPRWLWRGMRGEEIEIHGDGLQTRDFTYVDSVVDVLVDAVTRREVHDGPINLAFGRPHTLLDLISLMEQVLERPLRVRHVAPRRGDVVASDSDPTTLTSVFPNVQLLDLREAIEQTARWLVA